MLGDLAGVDDDLDRANTYYERAMALGETDADRDRARNCIHRAQYAERDGARLVFYEHGSGEPAIVFINPIVYGLATFEPILEQLCQEFRVITVDCRGAGRSDASRAPLLDSPTHGGPPSDHRGGGRRPDRRRRHLARLQPAYPARP